MNQGWIKLHRKLLDSALMKKGAYLQVWIALLLKANHKRNEFIFNDRKVVLEPGQLITGRKELSKLTGVHESKVQRILKYLENEHQIEQQTNNKFRCITILNWQFYQSAEQVFEQPVNSEQTSGEHLVNTNKNDKNEENEKNYGGGFHSEQLSQRQIVERAMKKLVEEGIY
jgi:DNA-binding transcriptional regulator YhcF (GntR family)